MMCLSTVCLVFCLRPLYPYSFLFVSYIAETILPCCCLYIIETVLPCAFEHKKVAALWVGTLPTLH